MGVQGVFLHEVQEVCLHVGHSKSVRQTGIQSSGGQDRHQRCAVVSGLTERSSMFVDHRVELEKAVIV